jgi:hypothetical protein
MYIYYLGTAVNKQSCDTAVMLQVQLCTGEGYQSGLCAS